LGFGDGKRIRVTFLRTTFNDLKDIASIKKIFSPMLPAAKLLPNLPIHLDGPKLSAANSTSFNWWYFTPYSPISTLTSP